MEARSLFALAVAFLTPADIIAAAPAGGVDSALLQAIKCGDYQSLRNATAAVGVDLNAVDELGFAALHWAVITDNGDALHELFVAPLRRSKLDVHKRDGWGNTPLCWAAAGGLHGGRGGPWGMPHQLQTPPALNTRCHNGATPLLIAAQSDNTRMLEDMLRAPGIVVNAADDDGQTPLRWALAHYRTELADRLLAVPGIDVNIGGYTVRQGEGEPAADGPLLQWAVAEGDGELVERLLDVAGVDVNRRGAGGKTPLVTAVEMGNATIAQMLLNATGIDVHATDERGGSALAAAMRGHDLVVARAILAVRARCDDDESAEAGDTAAALLRAVDEGDLDTAIRLAGREGVDINAIGPKGGTALMAAAGRGDITMVTALLNTAGIDVNAVDGGGRTALHHAAIGGHSARALLALLNQPETDGNAADDKGDTAIALAMRAGNWDAQMTMLSVPTVRIDPSVKYTIRLFRAASSDNATGIDWLLSQPGVDVNAKWRRSSSTPLMEAAGAHNAKAVAALLAAPGVDVNALDDGGRTALHRAASNCNGDDGAAEVVGALLAHPGIEADKFSERLGSTPLHVAVTNGCEPVVRALLPAPGVDATRPDGNGQTPLALAHDVGHERIAAAIAQRVADYRRDSAL